MSLAIYEKEVQLIKCKLKFNLGQTNHPVVLGNYKNLLFSG